MPTARELLEQAEALMHRERAALDIPTLTDSVRIAHNAAVQPAPIDIRRAAATLDDIPMLTEAIEDFDTPSIPLAQALDDELAMWRESAEPSALPVTPANFGAAVSAPETAPNHVETSSAVAAVDAAVEAPSVAPAQIEAPPIIAKAEPPVDDTARWNALAEDIRMQVLQRIDIFTDTGLKDQLNQRLQPIVDRASADLVAAINQHVGQLLRAYVAEAIEREIEKWREGAPPA